MCNILSQTPVLDKIPMSWYAVGELNRIFRAGRNSPPAVKSANTYLSVCADPV